MGLGLWGTLAVVAAIFAAIVGLMYWGLGALVTLAILFVIVCVVMMLVVLAQKPRGGGLAGAFGGAGGGGGQQTAFGAKTGDVMTWATIILFVAFIGLAMGLTWATLPDRDADGHIIPAGAGTQPVGDTSGGSAADQSTPSGQSTTDQSAADQHGVSTETAPGNAPAAAETAPATTTPAAPETQP